jgi:hypothetical protein
LYCVLERDCSRSAAMLTSQNMQMGESISTVADRPKTLIWSSLLEYRPRRHQAAHARANSVANADAWIVLNGDMDGFEVIVVQSDSAAAS